jgi:hypothetical protein
MNGSFLRASLFTSVVSFGIAAMAMGLGRGLRPGRHDAAAARPPHPDHADRLTARL